MAVSGAIPLAFDLPLVQIIATDPQRQFIWSGTLIGDGSGGGNAVTCTVPDGFGVMFYHLGVEMDASSTSNVIYTINEVGDSVYLDGATAINVAVLNRPHCFVPPPVIFVRPPITLVAVSDNVNLESIFVRCMAWAWDLQVARNLPQRFMWPAMVGTT